MNKGIFLLLTQWLGVKIKPEEIEAAWLNTKDALPKLAETFQQMELRLAALEKQNAEVIARLQLIQEGWFDHHIPAQQTLDGSEMRGDA